MFLIFHIRYNKIKESVFKNLNYKENFTLSDILAPLASSLLMLQAGSDLSLLLLQNEH